MSRGWEAPRAGPAGPSQPLLYLSLPASPLPLFFSKRLCRSVGPSVSRRESREETAAEVGASRSANFSFCRGGGLGRLGPKARRRIAPRGGATMAALAKARPSAHISYDLDQGRGPTRAYQLGTVITLYGYLYVMMAFVQQVTI